MTKIHKITNFNEMSSLLQDILKDKGYKQRKKEDNMGFPIHLFYVKDEATKDEDNLILQFYPLDVKPDKEFFNRLRFYMFSLHPQLIKVVIVVPWWIKSSSKKQIMKECKNINMRPYIGIWEIDNNGEIEEKVNPESIREAMKDKIRNDYFNYTYGGKKINIERLRNINKEKKLNDTIENICTHTSLSADSFINKSVHTLLLHPPHNKGETLICDVLMKDIYAIKNLNYSDQLIKIANKYFYHNPEDYPFVKECFNDLWKDSALKMKSGYPDIGGEYEALLKKLSPSYRDHFIHQFQVFIFGSIILDKIFDTYESDRKKKEIKNMSNGWILASAAHDFAYPLQRYDQWSNLFLGNILRFDEPLCSLELKSTYVENTSLSRIEHIIYSMSKYTNKKIKENDKVEIYNKIRRFLYYEITERKNHGLMGSLAILKDFEKKGKGLFSNIILPAAVAIATHDDDIWNVLSGQRNENEYEGIGNYIAKLLKIKEILLTAEEFSKKKDEFINLIKEKKLVSKWLSDIGKDCWGLFENPPMPFIDYEDQPLAFLLILCDNLQDWGRPYLDEKKQKSLMAADPKYKCITLDANLKNIKIELFTDISKEARKYLDEKIEELKVIKKVLKSKITFKIEYWNRKTNEEEKDYAIEIGHL